MAPPVLTLTTYDSAAAFRDRAQPFLMQQEAANNLILGLISGIIDAPQHYAEPPYLATVEAADTVVAAFIRTPPYRLIVSNIDHPATLELVARNLQAAGADLPGVTGPVALARAFAETWQARTGASWEVNRALRIYALRQVRPVSGVAGSLRRATIVDRDRLIDWFVAFTIEAETGADRAQIAHGIDTRLDNPHGGLWFWEVAGAPVCLVGASGLTPNGIRISPVYTPPEQRRHGYATAATAAVSQLLLDAGRRFVFLFTDQANPTANRIYPTIGYEPVSDTVDIGFAFPSGGR